MAHALDEPIDTVTLTAMLDTARGSLILSHLMNLISLIILDLLEQGMLELKVA